MERGSGLNGYSKCGQNLDIECILIQTHTQFQRTLLIRIKKQHANFQCNSLYQFTERHLKLNGEKQDAELGH